MSVCSTLEIKLFNGIVSDFSGRDMERIRVVVFVVNRLHGLDVLPEDCCCTFNLLFWTWYSTVTIVSVGNKLGDCEMVVGIFTCLRIAWRVLLVMWLYNLILY